MMLSSTATVSRLLPAAASALLAAVLCSSTGGSGVAAQSQTDDACGDPAPRVRIDFDEVNEAGILRNRGSARDVVARCTNCGLGSFIDGPIAGTTQALRWTLGMTERLDLSPNNQQDYPLNALTIAFWIRIHGDQPRESAVLDVDWSAGTVGDENQGYTVMFNRNSQTPRRLHFIIGRCNGQSGFHFETHSDRDLELNTWTQVIVTRVGSQVNIYFDGENVGSSSEFCSNAIATAVGSAFEDHSVSIGHFARRGHGFGVNNPGGPQRSNRLQQADVSLFRLYGSGVSSATRAMLAAGTCRISTTTTTTTSSTHTMLQGLHRRVDRIESNTSVEIAEALDLTETRINRNDGRVDRLQQQMAQVMGQLSNMTEVLRISQGENQINTATIARLTARVDGLLAVLNSTAADAGLAPPTVCDDASAAGGAPSIQVVGDDIKVLACGGAVEFSSSSCTVDPCRTQRDLDDIKARVGLL